MFLLCPCCLVLHPLASWKGLALKRGSWPSPGLLLLVPVQACLGDGVSFFWSSLRSRGPCAWTRGGSSQPSRPFPSPQLCFSSLQDPDLQGLRLPPPRAGSSPPAWAVGSRGLLPPCPRGPEDRRVCWSSPSGRGIHCACEKGLGVGRPLQPPSCPPPASHLGPATPGWCAALSSPQRRAAVGAEFLP